MDAAEVIFWNQRTYGTAIRLRRSWLLAASSILCMLTPATNWMLPFLGKIFPRDMMLRYERSR